jgi:hypothetical protein
MRRVATLKRQQSHLRIARQIVTPNAHRARTPAGETHHEQMEWLRGRGLLPRALNPKQMTPLKHPLQRLIATRLIGTPVILKVCDPRWRTRKGIDERQLGSSTLSCSHRRCHDLLPLRKYHSELYERVFKAVAETKASHRGVRGGPHRA